MLEVLLWTLWGLISLILIVLAAFICVVMYVGRYAFRLLTELPWMTWMTLDELVEKGYSRSLCRVILPGLYKKGMLEVRAIHDPNIALKESVKKFRELGGEITDEEIPILPVLEGKDFNSYTVPLFEFRITKRIHPRKFSLKRFFPKIDSEWEPATT